MSLSKILGIIIVSLLVIGFSYTILFAILTDNEGQKKVIEKDNKDFAMELPSNVHIIDANLGGWSDEIKIFSKEDFIYLVVTNNISIIYRRTELYCSTLYWIIINGIVNYIWL